MINSLGFDMQEPMTAAYNKIYADDPKEPEIGAEDIRNLENNAYEDSPYFARLNMICNIFNVLEGLEDQRVLNVGSGPQFLEWMMYALPLDCREGLSQEYFDTFAANKFFTLDIAKISRWKLMSNKNNFPVSSIPHTQADAKELPFYDNSMNIVYANFSVDFIPGREQIYKEIHRVLPPDGMFLANFHHGNLEKNGYGRTPICSWQIDYRLEVPLYSNREDICNDLLQAGFLNVEVELLNDRHFVESFAGYDEWWQVRAVK